MAQTYRVNSVKVVGDKDQYGNQAYSVYLSGVADPVFMKAQKAPEVGGEEYGSVTKETGKSGKEYYRFKRERKDEDGGFTKSTRQPRDDSAIQAQWAIRTAVQYLGSEATIRDVEESAKSFFAMIDRIKGGVTDAKKDEGVSGKDEVHEVVEDEPISLDDIPF